MIVIDASAALEVLLNTPAGEPISESVFDSAQRIHAPHLLDLEVTQVLRRLAGSGAIAVARCVAALDVLADLRILRHPHYPLLPRIWQLRPNVSAYDAAYIALAEVLDATLLTHDAKLAGAPGHHARIEFV